MLLQFKSPLFHIYFTLMKRSRFSFIFAEEGTVTFSLFIDDRSADIIIIEEFSLALEKLENRRK